jgi:GMP synthase (glutamine-hydrolysing)
MNSYVKTAIDQIRTTVKDDHVLCALSGGVDSSVAAALIAKAIGKNLTCVFVDHGLLRKDEALNVVKTFKQHFKLNFVLVDAKKQFLTKLHNVSDPEVKRKIIGHEFIQIFDQHTKNLKKIK